MSPDRSTPGPALLFQGEHIQGQKYENYTQVIHKVPDVQHTAGNAVEPRAAPQQAQYLCHTTVKKIGNCITTQKIDDAAQCDGSYQADNGIIGFGGYIQANGYIGAPQQGGCEIGRYHRPPIQVGDESNRYGQGEGRKQCQ